MNIYGMLYFEIGEMRRVIIHILQIEEYLHKEKLKWFTHTTDQMMKKQERNYCACEFI